jgi:hypothetical protein
MRTAYFVEMPAGPPLTEAGAKMGIPMPERRITSRQKSFLQGRVYYNNRRSSLDCLVRDVSGTGAKLVFGEAVTVPDAIELYLSNKDEVRRAKVQWRKGHEIGVDFSDDSADIGTAAGSGDLIGRVLKLERECAALKRTVNELRTDIRRMSSEPV